MIRIGVVDDHAIVRKGIKGLIAEEPLFIWVGEAANAVEAWALVHDVPMDVLILDLHMPGVSGVDILSKLKAARPAVNILVYSGLPQEDYAINALRQGAAGYCSKADCPSKLMEAIGSVHAGHRHCFPGVRAMLSPQSATDEVRNTVSSEHSAKMHQQFTVRQFQVFVRLARGQSTAHIAQAMGLSKKTIGTYKSQVKRRLGISNDSLLVRYAIENRLLMQADTGCGQEACEEGRDIAAGPLRGVSCS